MIKNILLITEHYTYDIYDNKYKLTDTEREFIDETFYNNATSKDTIKFFKAIGGKEYNKKSNTMYFGRRITKNISISPNGEYKSIRYYDFTDAYED